MKAKYLILSFFLSLILFTDLSAFPSERKAYLELLQLRSTLSQGKEAQAISQYEQLKSGETSILRQAKLEIAKYYFRVGKYDKSSEWARQIVESKDKTYTKDALELLVQNAVKLKDSKQALTYYAMRLSRYPRADESQELWSVVSKGLVKPFKKEDGFVSVPVRLEYIRNLIRDRYYEAALKEIAKFKNMGEKDTQTYMDDINFLKGIACFHSDRVYNAIDSFKALSTKKNIDPELKNQSLFYLGRALELSGQTSGAEKAYSLLINTPQENTKKWPIRAYYYLNRIHVKEGTQINSLTSAKEFKEKFSPESTYYQVAFEEEWRLAIKKDNMNVAAEFPKLFKQKSLSTSLLGMYTSIAKRRGKSLTADLLSEYPLSFFVMKVISDYEKNIPLNQSEKEAVEWLQANKLDGLLWQQLEEYRLSDYPSQAQLYAVLRVSQKEGDLYDQVELMDDAMAKGLQTLTPLPRLFINAAYPRSYKEEVLFASQKFNIEPALLWAVMKEESQFYKESGSEYKGVGIMRVEPIIAREILVTNGKLWNGMPTLMNPKDNIYAAAGYLKYLLKKNNNNVLMAVFAYRKGNAIAEKQFSGKSITNFDELLAALPRGQVRVEMEEFLETYLIYTYLSQGK